MADEPFRIVPKMAFPEHCAEESIALLEEALAEAKAGRVESVIIILRTPSGYWQDWRSPTVDTYRAIGYLESLKHEWLVALMRETDVPPENRPPAA